MHHSDTELYRFVRPVDDDLFAAHKNIPLIGLIQPEEDIHERGLACAVFPQKRMDFTLAQGKGNGVVGDNAGEPLGDSPHFDHHGSRWVQCRSVHDITLTFQEL
ncbi:hypothetical protein D3C75_981210 [compost metagenome]